jgi:hypothetical protein
MTLMTVAVGKAEMMIQQSMQMDKGIDYHKTVLSLVFNKCGGIINGSQSIRKQYRRHRSVSNINKCGGIEGKR